MLMSSMIGIDQSNVKNSVKIGGTVMSMNQSLYFINHNKENNGEFTTKPRDMMYFGQMI